MNGLDLFSGIGGGTLALAEWVRPVAYCENDESAQKILLTLQQKGKIPVAPIWDDIRTLKRRHIPIPVDIIYGGSPCQDFSVAGTRKGLDGEKSSLIFQVFRVIGEFRPKFVFLENSPNIVHLGLSRILGELTAMGYDANWTIVSAEEVGAPHLRERWWLLAHSNGTGIREQSKSWKKCENSSLNGQKNKNSNTSCNGGVQVISECNQSRISEIDQFSVQAGNTLREGRERWIESKEAWEVLSLGRGSSEFEWPSWLPKPTISRSDYGVSDRVDRLRGLGNAWVPQQAREAFKRLMGLK